MPLGGRVDEVVKGGTVVVRLDVDLDLELELDRATAFAFALAFVIAFAHVRPDEPDTGSEAALEALPTPTLPVPRSPNTVHPDRAAQTSWRTEGRWRTGGIGRSGIGSGSGFGGAWPL